MKAINGKTHADLFARYLGNLSLGDFNAIFEAQRNCWDAQLKHGDRGQLEAQRQARAAIEKAIGNMLPGDLAYIDAIFAKSQAN